MEQQQPVFDFVQPPGYYPPSVVFTQQQQPTVLLGSSPTVIISGVFGANPVQTTCPFCHNSVITSISFEIGLLCWILVGVLFFLGCWLCCCIPFCTQCCQEVVHTCPTCRNVIGRYTRLSTYRRYRTHNAANAMFAV